MEVRGVMGSLLDAFRKFVQKEVLARGSRTSLGEHVDTEDQGSRLKDGCIGLLPSRICLHLDWSLLVLCYLFRSPLCRPCRLNGHNFPPIETHLFLLITLNPLCLFHPLLLPTSQLQFLLLLLHRFDHSLILILGTLAILQIWPIWILVGVVGVIDHPFGLLGQKIAVGQMVELGLGMGREVVGVGGVGLRDGMRVGDEHSPLLAHDRYVYNAGRQQRLHQKWQLSQSGRYSSLFRPLSSISSNSPTEKLKCCCQSICEWMSSQGCYNTNSSNYYESSYSQPPSPFAYPCCYCRQRSSSMACQLSTNPSPSASAYSPSISNRYSQQGYQTAIWLAGALLDQLLDLGPRLACLVRMATKLLSSLRVLGSVFSRSISNTSQSLLLGRLRQQISKTYLSSVGGRRDILSANFFFQEVVILVKLLKLGCSVQGLAGGRILGLVNWNQLSLRRSSESLFWMLDRAVVFQFQT